MTPPPPDSSLAQRKLEGVHGVRGCAALCIVLFHIQFIPRIGLPFPANEIVGHLYLSVLVFFVVSAFSLCHSDQTSPSTYRAYLLKRFFRIAPMFYVVLLWNLDRAGWPGLGVFLANVTFTFNLFPGWEQSLVWAGWSVGVEVMFYLILPALLVVFRNASTAFIGYVIAACASVVLWRLFGANQSLSPHYAYFFIGSNLMTFMAGIWAYKIYLALPADRKRWQGAACAIAFAILFVAVAADPANLHWVLPGAYFSLWALCFAFLCFWQAAFPSHVMRFAPFQWLGDRSFSIYLLHPIVVELSRPLYAWMEAATGLGGAGLYAGCVAITLPIVFLVSEVSYRLIEAPGMRAGRRLAARVNRAAARQGAAVA